MGRAGGRGSGAVEAGEQVSVSFRGVAMGVAPSEPGTDPRHIAQPSAAGPAVVPAGRTAARRPPAPCPGRVAALLPGPSGAVGGPPGAARGDGPEHRGHLRRVECPRAAPRAGPLRRRPRPRALLRPRPGRGPRRDRPAGSLHLRGVGQRRAARLADRDARDAAALVVPPLPRRGGPLARHPDAADHRRAGGVRRAGGRGAGRERVRQLRRRPRLPGVVARRADRPGRRRAALHRRRADRADAGRRQPAGHPCHGHLRLKDRRRPPRCCGRGGPGSRSCAPSSGTAGSTTGASRTTYGRWTARQPPSPQILDAAWLGEHLHGARRHQRRPRLRRQPRRRTAPADRDQLRLRRPGRRERRPAPEVPPLPRAAARRDRRRSPAAAARPADADASYAAAGAGRRPPRRADRAGTGHGLAAPAELRGTGPGVGAGALPRPPAGAHAARTS